MQEINFTTASTCAGIGKPLRLPEPPYSLFLYFKNYVSLDVISSLKKEPGSIALVSFGNLTLLQHLDHKPSTSIEENLSAKGMEAAHLIFHIITRQKAGKDHIVQYIKVPCKLIIHE